MGDRLDRLRIPVGGLVFREGEAGDCAYVVEVGAVEITALRNGQQVLVARLGEGELFGEMALIDGQVRSATARAAADSTLVVVQRDQVADKIESADPVLRLFLSVILQRLRRANKLMDLRSEGGAEGAAVAAEENGSGAAIREEAMDRIRVEQELRQGVAGAEMVLRLQPITDTRTRRPAGFEALVRWRHPDRGLVSPGEFVSLAEETGLIVPIGRWVLEKACETLVRFQAARPQGLGPLFMAVNLSARQIADPSLVGHVQEVLAETRIEPHHLKLEVTESVLMADPDRAVEVLGRIHALGVRLAVDDFGTGYSSLSYLNRFPFHTLKIDRSFVSTMLSDPGNLKIVRAVTTLAKELGLDIVAEGVERQEEFTLVRDFGCEYAQGYLFSRPLSLKDAAEYLTRHGA